MSSHFLSLQFVSYTGIGLLNTAVHWTVFGAVVGAANGSQALGNVLGFLAAASGSFLLNARLTFRAAATLRRYGLFVVAMGLLSLATGHAGDVWNVSPWITLVGFSALSLGAGFLISRHWIFREAP